MKYISIMVTKGMAARTAADLLSMNMDVELRLGDIEQAWDIVIVTVPDEITLPQAAWMHVRRYITSVPVGAGGASFGALYNVYPKWTPQHEHVYQALRKSAERIGNNGYNAALIDWQRNHRGRRPPYTPSIYVPTEAHIMVITAMRELQAFTITPEEAMAVIHDYDVFRERFANVKH